MADPFVTSISVDYSDDELDALASAFLRPDLARRADRAGGSAIQRAQHQTALRGLVARRAIALGGAPGKPRIRFLEPHATMLDAFLNAPAVVRVRIEERGAARATTLFATAAATVHQTALPGQGIQRMTAYGPRLADELLGRELGLGSAGDAEAGDAEPGEAEAGTDGGERRGAGGAGGTVGEAGGAGPSRGDRFDLSRAAMRAAVGAIDAERPVPRDVPAGAADVLFARRSSGNVAVSARGTGGSRVAGSWTWIDAGDLGFWKLVPLADDQYVSLQRTTPAGVAAEVLGAWGEVCAEALSA